MGKNMFNSANCSWPLASLSITEEQVRISAILRRITIRREEIARIRLHRVVFWREYRFELKDPKRMPYISFWCWNLKRVLVALEEHGWQVDLAAKPK